MYAAFPHCFLFAPLGSRGKHSISLQVWFYFEMKKKWNAGETYWIILAFSCPLCLLSPPLLAPAATYTLHFGMGCVSPPHAHDMHVFCSCCGKSTWTEFPPEERSVLCLQGPLSVCWRLLTNTPQFFTLLERKCVWLHTHRHLLLVNLLSTFILKVTRTTPPKPLQRKDWAAGIGSICCPKKPVPAVVIFLS